METVLTFTDQYGCVHNVTILDMHGDGWVKVNGKCRHCQSTITNKWLPQHQLQTNVPTPEQLIPIIGDYI